MKWLVGFMISVSLVASVFALKAINEFDNQGQPACAAKGWNYTGRWTPEMRLYVCLNDEGQQVLAPPLK